MSTTVNQVIVSDVNQTPIVQIATWFCLVTSLLAFFTHACIRFYVYRSWTAESALMLTSLVFCTAQSVVVILQTEHGFGKPLATLSVYDAQINFKCEYAATIFLFVSLGCSKLAIVTFIHNLTPFQLHRKINFGVGIFTSLCFLTSVLLAVFQCRMPHPWDRTRDGCVDRYAWWNAVSILNIITEAVIVTLKLGITAQLHIARTRKAIIMTIFACRSLVLVAAAVQLVFFHQESKDISMNHDLTLGFWRSTICNQVVQCLAIVTTCLPYTKLFMVGCESGLLRLDDMRRRGEHTTKDDSRKEYQLMDVSHSAHEKSINVSKSWTVQVEPAGQVSFP